MANSIAACKFSVKRPALQVRVEYVSGMQTAADFSCDANQWLARFI